MSADLLWQMAGFLVLAGAVYGGIRKDLERMHQRQERLERSIDKLRERVGDCVACYGRRIGDK